MELLGRLSSGGMGEVLLARRRGAHGFEKLMAVKTIRGDLARREDIRRMFLDEAKLLARLDHPAIAQVYDFGEEGQILFLAMEYVHGIVLSRLFKQRKKALPPAIATRIAIEICRGLHFAHELADAQDNPLGVVHRDVSPHNLMLTFDGRVKVLDFGIALRRDRKAPPTEFGVVKGKLTYVAPEQLAGGKADRRSDLYSVGVVLHEMLTGKKLFTSTNPVADAEDRKTVPKPSVVSREISSQLDAAVLKALTIDPAKRYATAREFAGALERCLASLGGETLEEFTERELKDIRREHKARIAAVTAGNDFADLVIAEPPSIPAIELNSFDVLVEDVRKQLPPPSPPKTMFLERHQQVKDPASSPGIEDDLDWPKQARRRRWGAAAAVAVVALGIAHATTDLGAAAQRAWQLVQAGSSGLLALNDPGAETEPLELTPPIAEPVPSVAVPTVPTTSIAVAVVVPTPKPEEPKPEPVKSPPEVAKVSSRAGKVTAAKGRESRSLGTGFLTVEAKNISIVVIDGKTVGTTPLRNLRLSAGRHDLELRKPYARTVLQRRKLHLRDGQRVRFNFQR